MKILGCTLVALILVAPGLFAQTRGAEPVAGSAKMKTDDRIAAFGKAVAAQPGNAHLRNRLARAYIQKMRETVDFSYLERASTLVEEVLDRDPGNDEALRLRSEIDMERHEFARVADAAREIARFAPDDASNWGATTNLAKPIPRSLLQDAGAASGTGEL